VGKGQAQYKAAQDEEKLYAPVAIDEEGIEQAGGGFGSGEASLGSKVAMNVKQQHQHDSHKADTIDLREVEVIGSDAAEFVVKAGEHGFVKSKVESC